MLDPTRWREMRTPGSKTGKLSPLLLLSKFTMDARPEPMDVLYCITQSSLALRSSDVQPRLPRTRSAIFQSTTPPSYLSLDQFQHCYLVRAFADSPGNRIEPFNDDSTTEAQQQQQAYPSPASRYSWPSRIQGQRSARFQQQLNPAKFTSTPCRLFDPP
jgi:hypothetical protein